MDYFHLCAGQDTMEQISVLGLAHLGDGVYELMVRAWLCLHGKATNKGLHRAAVTYVSAPAQAPAGAEDFACAHAGGAGRVPAGAATAIPQRFPREPAWPSITQPLRWRRYLAGCTCGERQTGSTNCSPG